jgi:hypothetical protein
MFCKPFSGKQGFFLDFNNDIVQLGGSLSGEHHSLFHLLKTLTQLSACFEFDASTAEHVQHLKLCAGSVCTGSNRVGEKLYSQAVSTLPSSNTVTFTHPGWRLMKDNFERGDALIRDQNWMKRYIKGYVGKMMEDSQDWEPEKNWPKVSFEGMEEIGPWTSDTTMEELR